MTAAFSRSARTTLWIEDGAGNKVELDLSDPTIYLPARLTDGSAFYTASGGGGGTVTANQGTAGASAWPVLAAQDGAWSVSVSGTVAVTQSGAWAVSVSNFPATQPVSGTVAVTQSTTPWGVQLTDGLQTADLLDLATQPTDANVGLITMSMIHGHTTAGGGAFVDVKVNPSGSLTVDASGTTVPISAVALPLPTGAATEVTLAAIEAILNVAQGAATDGLTGPMVQGIVNDAPQSYLSSTLQALSLTNEGRLRVSSVPAALDIAFFDSEEVALFTGDPPYNHSPWRSAVWG